MRSFDGARVSNDLLSAMSLLSEASSAGRPKYCLVQDLATEPKQVVGASIAALLSMGFDIRPFCRHDDVDVLAWARLWRVVCICLEPEYSAQNLSIRSAYTRRMQELRGRRDFKTYGEGCKYHHEFQLQAAFKAAAEAEHTKFMKEVDAAEQQNMRSKRCFAPLDWPAPQLSRRSGRRPTPRQRHADRQIGR